MPKIRTIKPEFWTDGVMVNLSPLARLLFIGTWNFTLCDNGHLPDDPMRLRLQILPLEDCDVECLIGELIDAGRIDRIEVEGRSYLHIRRFTDHQRTETRWSPRCPACTPSTSPNLTEPLETSREVAQTRATTTEEGKGREGKGREKVARRAPETTLPADWQPTEAHQKYAAENRVDLGREAFKFRHHAEANDRRQRNWNSAFSTWLAKASEWAPPAKPAVRTDLPEAWR